MEYIKFKDEIVKRLKVLFGEEYEVYEETIIKNNSINLEAITVYKSDCRVSPNFYVKDLYNCYRKGIAIEEICDWILKKYFKSIKEKEFDNIDLSFEHNKDNIVMKLVSKDMNSAILDTIPHWEYLDLCVSFHLVISVKDNSVSSMRITNDLFDTFKEEDSTLNTEKLLKLARKNTERILPACIYKMDDFLQMLFTRKDLSECKLSEVDIKKDILVVSNKYQINGATSILYESVIKKLAKIFKKGFFLIPSSVHETIIINDNMIDIHNMIDMIKDVNHTVIKPQEILSDSLYYYDINKKQMKIIEY